MRTYEKGKHYRMVFDSFDEYVTFSEDNPARNLTYMSRGFNGVNSLAEAIKLGREGLVEEGIDATNIAEDHVKQIDKDLISQRFNTQFGYAGDFVDTERFLMGDPECMVSYPLEDTSRTQRIVTLVLALFPHCGISTSAIQKHGQALMSLVEAIEHTGLQVEVWGDLTGLERSPSMNGENENQYIGRQSVLLKAAGEWFDPTMFMYALTHASMARALGFNAYHAMPDKWIRALSIGGHYTYPAKGFPHKDDYPDGSIFIPMIRSDREAGALVESTLRELNLLAENA